MTRDRHLLLPAPVRALSRPLGRQLRDLQRAFEAARARVHPAPTFLLGNQKSGTSVVAALVGAASGLDVTIDLLREVWGPTFHRIPSGEVTFEQYLRRNRHDFARPIIKEPNLTLFYEPLRERFPDSRFGIVVRDPRDNVRSLLQSIDIPGDLDALDPSYLEPLNPGWLLVLDARWRGIEGEHYIDQLAHRWNYCADVYLDRPDDFALCHYEDFLADKEGEIARFTRALGLEVRHPLGDRVDVQYQSKGTRGVSALDYFGERNLARIEDICGERMARLGYARSGEASR